MSMIIEKGTTGMINAEKWILTFTDKLKTAFADRLLFVGLQGSYSRGEAREDSDIDIMVVLADLGLNELKAYRELLATMPDNEKACGFIAGKDELLNWPKYEIFQLVQQTKTYHGSLAGLLPEIKRKDIVDSAQIGVANLYHAACHTYLYEKQEERSEALKGIYKGAFFVLQVLHYLRSGLYVHTKKDLLPLLSPVEQEILSPGMCWDEVAYKRIINWCTEVLKQKL